MNPEGLIHFNTDPLARILLKFNLDWHSEYEDIDEENKLIHRES